MAHPDDAISAEVRPSVGLGPNDHAEAPKPAGPPPSAGGPSATFLFTGLVVGLYATLTGFYVASLHVQQVTQVTDYIIPGMVVLAMVYVAIRWGDSSRSITVPRLVTLLAGVWMVVSHIGLVGQSLRQPPDWAAVFYEGSTALTVLMLAVVWIWHYREALPDDA
ncbi:MAG: hypothetical protein ACYC1D_15050 [Acidimicrobiales bacterium]